MTAPSRVTHSRKRYRCPRVFVCIGCDLLACSERSHAIACPPACRVRIHRHPDELRRVEALAASMHITVMDIQDAAAVRRLRPELSGKIAAGEVEMDDARPDVWAAYLDLLPREATP